jgi:hypothetical protein
MFRFQKSDGLSKPFGWDEFYDFLVIEKLHTVCFLTGAMVNLVTITGETTTHECRAISTDPTEGLFFRQKPLRASWALQTASALAHLFRL